MSGSKPGVAADTILPHAEPRGIAWRLFLTCWLVYLLFVNPAGNVMSNTILGATVSLAEGQSFDVNLRFPQEAPDLSFVVYRTGVGPPLVRHLSGLPPGASLAAVPCYTPAWWLKQLLPQHLAHRSLFGIDEDVMRGAGFQVPPGFALLIPPLIYWLQLVAAASLSTTAAAGTVVLCYLVLRHLRFPLWERLTASFALAFGTSLFPHAITYGTEALGTFLSFAAFAVICLSPPDPRVQRRWLTRAGCLAGAATAVDYWAGVISLLLVFYSFRKAAWSGVRALLLGMATPIVLLGFYHQLFFGAPWKTAYSFRALALVTKHQTGLAGLTGLNPLALWGLSFSPFQGLFVYQAFLLAAVLGVLVRWRLAVSSELILSLVILVGLFLFSASSQYLLTWNGALIGRGPSRMILAMPFITVLLASGLDAVRSIFWRGLMLGLVGVSVAIQCLGAAWGGAAFPDAHAATLVLIGNVQALQVRPIALMAQAVLQRGFSAPLFRVYSDSDAAAMLWTILSLLLIAWSCLWIWSPLLAGREHSTGRPT